MDELVNDQTVAAILTGMEAIGVVAFALSGVLAATRARFDVVGVSVVALLTALGGGTLRDLLLDREPFFGWPMSSGCGSSWVSR